VSAFGIGKRLHLLHEGRILLSGTPDEFRASKDPVVLEFLARATHI